jgi:hypothetical protein
MLRRFFILVPLIILLALFSIFIWPTRYRHDITTFHGQPAVLLTDRFTRDVSIIQSASDLPQDAKTLLQWSPIPSPSGTVNLKVYNGSGWAVQSATVRFDVLYDKTVQSTRRFNFKAIPAIGPQTTSYLTEFVGLDVPDGDTWRWEVENVKGIPTGIPTGSMFDELERQHADAEFARRNGKASQGVLDHLLDQMEQQDVASSREANSNSESIPNHR